jgi:hypothetical protein
MDSRRNTKIFRTLGLTRREEDVMKESRDGDIELICLWDTRTDLIYGLRATTVEEASIESINRARKEKVSLDEVVPIDRSFRIRVSAAIDTFGEGL